MKHALLALLIATIPVAALGMVPHSPAEKTDDNDGKAWWPQFLGPDRNGMSPEKGLNIDWKKTPPKVLWKVPLGDGFSSFAVVGERAYTMCERGKRCIVVCLDTTTGKEVWSHDVAGGYLDQQRQGAGPRSTPTYHDGKLYCLMPMGELVCLSAADGKRLWTANEFKDTGSPNPAGQTYYWGAAVSPLVLDDLLIVQPGGPNNKSVAAYHKDSGKLVWTAGNDPPGYGSAICVTIAGTRQLIVPTGSSLMGLEPTKGKVLWRYPIGNKYNITGTSPVWVDNLLWISAAYGAGVAVLQINGKGVGVGVGDVWTATELWKDVKKIQTLYSTAMTADGHAYGCHGDLSAFALKCVEIKTGKIKWEQRMDNRQWLLAFDGHVLCWGDSGSLKLLEMQPQQYMEKGELPRLLGAKSWAAPALADGRLYLRDLKNAVCVDLRKHKP